MLCKFAVTHLDKISCNSNFGRSFYYDNQKPRYQPCKSSKLNSMFMSVWDTKHGAKRTQERSAHLAEMNEQLLSKKEICAK